MSLRLKFARQLGYPKGLAGRLVGTAMARGNAGFNAWVVNTLRAEATPGRILELGFGPGVATAGLLAAFPAADVFGIERSTGMFALASRRNRAAIAAGRLRLVQGETAAVPAFAPLDLILAVHVIYFWADPVAPLQQLRAALAPTGVLALGLLLARDMPARARNDFPLIDGRVYETEDDVRGVLLAAGFRAIEFRSKPDAPGLHGRLVLSTP